MKLHSDQPARRCAACGQAIPPSAKLTAKRKDGSELCLACSIREAQIEKGLKH